MDNVHQRLGKCAQPTAHPLSRTITKLFLDFTQNFLHTPKTGKTFAELDPEGWYDTSLFNLFMETYARYSVSGERAIVTLGRNVYPTIKKSAGLPPHLKTPLDFIKFEAEGFLANHRGSDVQPRKFISTKDGDVLVQAPAPGYNPKLYEGVFLGILEMSGVKTGKVVQTKARANGDATDEFHITW
jgi:hypothetical protein